MQHTRKSFAFTLLLTLACCLSLSGQTITGTFTGTVSDATGAVIPNVKITATNTGTNLPASATTNRYGVYNLLFLPVGSYNIVAESAGFKKAQTGPFSLETNQIARVDLKLEIGDASQSVTVDATSVALQTESTQTGGTLDSTKLTSLPLNGRNFASLTLLVPGAITTNPQGIATSQRFQSRPFVNGNREQTNNFMLDGVDVNDSMDNRIGYQPSVDALEEVKVLTGNIGADYGNAGGASVMLSIKSGTNAYHGSAFEFLRNSELDANGYFRNRNLNTAKRNNFKRNIFGGTVGGPIKQNKVFFFLDYEGTLQRDGGPASASVAPLTWRNGDLSQFPVNVIDPLTGAPFPNKQIPASRIVNPVAKKLFSSPNLYPLPNQPGTGPLGISGNYASTTANTINNHQADAKVDIHPNEKDSIWARWSISRYEQFGSAAALPVQMTGGQTGPTTSAVLNWTRAISSTIVNEARTAYSRVVINDNTNDWSGLLGANGNQSFGISGGQPIAGLSSVNLGSGLSGVGNGASIGSTVDNKFMYYDNLTVQKGKHLLKMGAQFTRTQQNRYYAGNNGALGIFNYTSTYTGLDYADFLTDQLSSKGRGAVVGKYGHRSWRSSLFFQDDVKLTSTFTLNIGLRWEYMQPIYEVADRMANVNTQTGEILYAGKNGASRALYNGYWKQFMPRVGFAYTPDMLHGKFVVRAGYAYTSFMEGTGGNLRLPLNPPFFVESNLTYDARTPGTITSGFADVNTQNVTLNGPRPANTIVPQLQGRAWDFNLRPQTTQQINFTGEYQLDSATTVSAGYVGQRGRHLIAPHEANQPLPGTGPYATWTNQETRRPLYNILPNLGNIALTEASATMDYNSLQASARRRFSYGLDFIAAYTWANTLTDNLGYYGGGSTSGEGAYWQNAYNRKGNRGPAFFDVRHNFSLGGSYELPVGKTHRMDFGGNRVADLILGGWSTNYTVSRRTGFPVTVLTGTNNTGQAVRGNIRANHYRSLTSNGTSSVDNFFGVPIDLSNSSVRASAFCATGVDNGTCAYGQASNGSFGNAGIGTERGPSYFSMDGSVGKKFRVTERQYIDFRAEFFNMFNHVSWGPPGRSISDNANFGVITSQVQAPRNIQFGLKYIF